MLCHDLAVTIWDEYNRNSSVCQVGYCLMPVHGEYGRMIRQNLRTVVKWRYQKFLYMKRSMLWNQ